MIDSGVAGVSADPAVDRVGLGRLLTFVVTAMSSMFAVFQGIQQILIPAQVDALDPTGKVGTLALLTTLAAVASLIALPAGGAVSDRTRSRFGRRAPWILLMALVSAGLTVVMGLATALPLLAVAYMVLWFTANFYQGAAAAILPDRVPEGRRGLASALIGLGTPIGVLVGVNIASRVSQFWGYTTIGLILVAASLLLVIGAPEPSSVGLARPERNPGALRAAIPAFFAAFRSRDFSLAFVSRFGFFLAYFTVSGYLYFTLQDYIGTANLPGGDVAVAVSTLTTVTVLTWVVVATGLGWLADRLDRRKLFCGISSAGLAASLLVPVISPTWTGMLIYAVASGAFIGTYFAVDLAVMSLVLPDKLNEGRDFGILAVATGLPQILSSVIAGGLITFLGGYVALFAFGAICAVVAGFVIMRIRALR
ncbi:MFS transporter [Pseudonocardia sp. GCM10023141]|uniref:MFS transporter n=1 Tax=Pseudonocardia sp. GCM10023141 TaxID=3252653 RepID=UPI003621597A